MAQTAQQLQEETAKQHAEQLHIITAQNKELMEMTKQLMEQVRFLKEQIAQQ